jgi:hypothetical protein
MALVRDCREQHGPVLLFCSVVEYSYSRLMNYKVTDVFVPGGLPKHTYVARTGRNLEDRISSAKNNLCKIMTVTGATKCGKTVLVRKVIGREDSIWIDGGSVQISNDFWDLVSDQLEVVDEQEESSVTTSSSQISSEFSAEANALVAKGQVKWGPTTGSQESASITRKRSLSKKREALAALRRSPRPIVIDDFHYLRRETQGDVTRVLKPLVFEGVPVIYIAIPHRRFDAVKVEREMNGRVENVQVPTWEVDELKEIAQLGFPLLNIQPEINTSIKLAREAQGSPHLMQEFCKKICFQSGVQETAITPRSINPTFPYEQIFREVAEDLGKNIFERLARGPRTRTDRKPRKLKTGHETDIYRVVLIALAELKPNVETIEYEPLRASIRGILNEGLPQANEVSRVLEQMAKISSTDESSVPVIDYEKDERKLHITDPFFAFFLRWGKNLIDV